MTALDKLVANLNPSLIYMFFMQDPTIRDPTYIYNNIQARVRIVDAVHIIGSHRFIKSWTVSLSLPSLADRQ